MNFFSNLKILFIYFLFINLLNSQVRMPFSPDVMAFKQYSDFPVSEYTGVANIGFPILDMNGIVINLRYHSSGLKVSQEASSVGLGWNLQVGGVITQDIRGYDDFDSRYPFPSQNDVFWQLNTVNSSSFYDRENMANEANRPHPYIPFSGIDYTIKNYYTGVVEGIVQPDIYNFSFGGYDGKFVINPTTKEVLLFDRSQNIKFEFTYNTLNLTSFIATTPDGNKYYFDNVKQSYESGQYIDNVQPYISHSFYLNRIVMTDGQQIKFDYDAPQGTFAKPYGNVNTREVEVKTLGPGIAISDSFATVIEGSPSQASTSGSFNPFTTYNKYQSSVNYNKVTLKSIISDKIKVFFDSSSRLDCMDEDKIDRIRIEDYSGNTINKFDFSYSYFNDHLTYYDNGSRYDNLRLKLNAVTENGKPPYVFNYNEKILQTQYFLPSKKSYSTDFWGYYNGKNNTSALIDPKQMLYYDAKYFDKDDDFETSLDPGPLFWTPTAPSFLGIYYTATYKSGGTADKIASEDHSKIGMLQEVIHPEGGKTKFTYENNTFSNRIYPSQDDIEGDHIVDENFQKKIIYFEVKDTVGIKIKADFSMGDNPANFEKIMNNNLSYVKIYSFNSNAKPLESVSNLDSKTLIIHKNWKWKESTPSYTTATLTNYISYNEDFYKFYPGQYMMEVELSDDCGIQGSPANHAYVYAQLAYSKRKVRMRGREYSSAIGKGAGLRIKEINNYDADNTLVSFQKFTYDEKDKTNGKLILPILFKTHTKGKALEILNFNFGGTPILNCTEQDQAIETNRLLAKAGYPNISSPMTPCTLESNNASYTYTKGYLLGGLDIYAFDSNPIPDMSTFGYEYYVGYDKVKIEKNSDGGGFTNKYFINNVAKASGQLLKIPAIPNTLNGSVRKIEVFNSGKVLVKKDEYEYQSFDKKFLRGCFAIDTYSGPTDFKNLLLVSLYTYNIGTGGTLSDQIMAGRYHMYFYPINSSLDVISKHRETFYFDQASPIVKERLFSYNTIGQLTKETLTESNLLVSSTEYEYPFDSYGAGGLLQKNFLNYPLRITSKLNNTILKESKFYYGMLSDKGPLLNYKTIANGNQNDLITDKYFYTAYTDTYNNSIAKINEEFKTYENSASVNITKSPKTKYIYGYNYKYIVAKIEGLDYDSTENFISESAFQNYAGTTLEDYLNQNLRNNPQVLALNLMVTTYTYDTVTGQLLSLTDPRGLTTNYIYDSLHRLKHVTDHQGKVIKNINYNYKQ